MNEKDVQIGEYVHVEFTGKVVGYDSTFNWLMVEVEGGNVRNVSPEHATPLDGEELLESE